VEVWLSAVGSELPSESRTELFWPKVFKKPGAWKLVWFRMLKNSARNCTLKASEIFAMWVFLKTERSTVVRCGP
jgi:hypothetical protein